MKRLEKAKYLKCKLFCILVLDQSKNFKSNAIIQKENKTEKINKDKKEMIHTQYNYNTFIFLIYVNVVKNIYINNE